jgi:hypothetical protein
MWSEVRFMSYAYGKKFVGRREPTLCATQVLQRRLVIDNGVKILYQYHGNPKIKSNVISND